MRYTYNLKGNLSLIIFKKLLVKKEIFVFSVFNDIIEGLIENNMEYLIDSIDSGKIKIETDSKLYFFYNSLKTKYLKEKEKEIDFEELSSEELEKIKLKTKR